MLLPTQMREDFQELTRLAAAVTDAHSSAIFLPTNLLAHWASAPSRSSLGLPSSNRRDSLSPRRSLETGNDPRLGSIELVSVHSYAKLARDCRIQVGSGLLGWVADQGRPIHLASFDVGSSTLGLYVNNEAIKSLVAVPIVMTTESDVGGREACGVLMCDSLRPDGFTNAHVKVLEQLANHVSRLVRWVSSLAEVAQLDTSWEIFSQKTHQLGEAIGASSIEILRARIDSSTELVRLAGVSAMIQLAEQFIRLAQQALPPHFPLVRIPTGDILIAVDSMMSSFFQQKLQTLALHLSSLQKPFSISIDSFSSKVGPHGRCDLDATLQQQPLSKKPSSSGIGGSRA
jgi:hypothetical protein